MRECVIIIIESRSAIVSSYISYWAGKQYIYNFLVDQKVVVKKASDLESVADRRAELLCNPEKGDTCVFHND